jgi:hypothetical protein
MLSRTTSTVGVFPIERRRTTGIDMHFKAAIAFDTIFRVFSLILSLSLRESGLVLRQELALYAPSHLDGDQNFIYRLRYLWNWFHI